MFPHIFHLSDITMRKFPATQHLHPTVCAERGVFCLGNPTVDLLALNFVQQQKHHNRTRNGSDTIIVSGDGMKALCVLGRLEAQGVDPGRIVWIRTRDSPFSDIDHDDINALVEDEFFASDGGKPHMTVYSNVDILDVEFGVPVGAPESSSERMIEGIHIRNYPPKNSVMVPKDEFMECCALLCCSKEQCDVDVFAAINDTGLVYDGGVVVDEKFRTVDPLIYAVGPMTKYSRRHKDQIQHRRCNSRELGMFVAKEILQQHLTEGAEAAGDASAEFAFQNSRAKLPSVENVCFHRFRMPRILAAMFPGSIQFFISSLPERKECSKNDRYLVSGPREDRTQRTCGVTFDTLGVCCEIVCAQRVFLDSPIADPNINVPASVGPMVGWHESYLNSAVYAFECAHVVDWVEFFSEEWSAPLRCDKYPLLCDMIRKSLYSDKGMIAILDKIMETAESVDDNLVVNQARRKLLGDRGMYIEEGTKTVVVDYTIDFLRKNKSLFPNLFIPAPPATSTSTGRNKKEAKQ